ncbi:ABC-type transport auxiliary lipoprotein family protein [Neisseria sp. Ec49-e6-T10]|uniref:ABC-type transport auxiliary lipoprotein family protein n=1 Tax=Neisseria sp. Ec49-e6-T10 TaxID=3140744 RepID=UPI003EBB2D7A
MLRLKLFLILTLLSACSVLPTPPSLQSYLLPSYTDTTQNPPYQTIKASLRINQPYTSHFLSTTRIVAQSQGNELAVYKGARWADPTPILFRNRVIQEFRTDGRIKALSSDDDHLQADYELNGDLLAFQGVSHSEGNKVLIRFYAKLTRTSDKSIIASQTFEVSQAINGRNIDGVIKAFGLANDRLNAQLLTWAIQNMH